MGRWQALGTIAALALLAGVAVAQPEEETPESQGFGATDEAADVYADALLLMTVRRLQLTEEQMQRLQALHADVAEQRAELARLREEVWQDHHDDIEAVNQAWLTGSRVPSRKKRAADRAINDLRAEESDLRDAEWEAVEDFLRTLSDGQRALVEGPAQARERIAREQRMGGISSVGDFILVELDALRDLMPDEYRVLAEVEARRIATALVGPDAPNLGATTAAVLAILDQVHSWAPPHYQQQRETLPEQIEAALGIPQPAPDQVGWDDLLRLMRSDRTPTVLRALRQSGGGEEQ